MKVLLITTGSRGDIQPFIALAHGLMKAGHKAMVAAPRRFASLAEIASVSFTGLDDSAFELQDELVGAGARAAVTAVGRVKPFMRRWLDDLAQLVDVEADAVVCTQKTLGGLSIAERLGVPAMAAQLIPTCPSTSQFAVPFAPRATPRFLNRASWKLTAAAERPWRGMVQRWRTKRLGLTGPAPDFAALVGANGILSAWSPSLLPSPPDWPDRARPFGFWTLPTRSDWEPPSQLRDFLHAGQPPVLVGFGSMRHRDSAALTLQVAQGLRSSGRRAIMVAGWAGIGDGLTGDDLLVIDEAPYDWLMPRTSVAVHHGGVGTCAAALTAGIPQVVHPFFGDQPFWARRLTDLGVAPEPLRRLTADSLTRAVEEALRLTDAAKDLANGVRADDAMPATIDHIERRVAHP